MSFISGQGQKVVKSSKCVKCPQLLQSCEQDGNKQINKL